MSVVEQLKKKEVTSWFNPNLREMIPLMKINGYGFIYTKAAQNRFMRFLPYIASAFPETAAKKGVIESNLIPIPAMQQKLKEQGIELGGKLFLKDDAHLPIAGSVKARGGIHEVLKIAEFLLQKEGKLNPTDNYKQLDSDEFRAFFSNYTIQVGSTGNLGLSIGRSASRMGFKVIVHMSSDAKEWKKELLRSEGVFVKEYDGDYSQAVARGREESAADENSFFIDDENSEDLFFGYSTAALRLKIQIAKAKAVVDHEHPLFVYLPCGVGGAPGGITFGLKHMYGDDVHCFFVEPVNAPCVTYAMASGTHGESGIDQLGLDGKTIADGLAVGKASTFVCQMMDTLMSGACTVEDEDLISFQEQLLSTEGIRLEPSACAGFGAIKNLPLSGEEWEKYLEEHDCKQYMNQANHIVWGTGGGLMP